MSWILSLFGCCFPHLIVNVDLEEKKKKSNAIKNFKSNLFLDLCQYLHLRPQNCKWGKSIPISQSGTEIVAHYGNVVCSGVRINAAQLWGAPSSYYEKSCLECLNMINVQNFNFSGRPTYSEGWEMFCGASTRKKEESPGATSNSSWAGSVQSMVCWALPAQACDCLWDLITPLCRQLWCREGPESQCVCLLLM